jgi:hypothetical protein
MIRVTYPESGLYVHLDADQSFRFSDTQFYKARSGRNLKEIDFGWWDAAKKTLWLMELKGEEVWDQEEQHHLVNVLQKKAVDSLLMLGAMWSGRSPSAELAHELPDAIAKLGLDAVIRLVVVIPTPAKRKHLLSAVATKLNQMMAGQIELFGIHRVSVMDADSAVKMGLPVTTL